MITVGVEIDMVVTDSLAALSEYEEIFDVERLEVTEFPQGSNEAIFTIYGTRFHLLDENPEYFLVAPGENSNNSFWFNVLVEDIEDVFKKAKSKNWTVLQEVIKLEEMGVSNAILKDNFGYMWMLHELHKVVSFEERVEMFKEKMGK
ncbi:MAG: VOC family protein [Tissierellia bacterium]|nr:VOC family protein [Tissierellia bacterium]